MKRRTRVAITISINVLVVFGLIFGVGLLINLLYEGDKKMESSFLKIKRYDMDYHNMTNIDAFVNLTEKYDYEDLDDINKDVIKYQKSYGRYEKRAELYERNMTADREYDLFVMLEDLNTTAYGIDKDIKKLDNNIGFVIAIGIMLGIMVLAMDGAIQHLFNEYYRNEMREIEGEKEAVKVKKIEKKVKEHKKENKDISSNIRTLELELRVLKSERKASEDRKKELIDEIDELRGENGYEPGNRVLYFREEDI